MAHAELSPSAAHRWLRCQASIVLSKDIENTSSQFAAEGTVAHEIGYLCLRDGLAPETFLGQTLTHDGYSFVVDAAMAAHVQTYVDYVQRLSGHLLPEQKLPIMHITGEQGAHGTADAVVIADDVMHIVDLKYGMGVKVEATGNEQLQIYALAALHFYDMLADFSKVCLHIVQPRIDHIDSWEVSVDDLKEFGFDVRLAAQWVDEAKVELQEKHFVPGTKQCKFCPAKGQCKPLADHILSTLADDFIDMTQPITHLNQDRTLDNQSLGHLMAALPLVEEFVKAIRARVESELLGGNDVPGFKLVQGRAGIRKWRDEDAAIKLLGEMAWEQSLISPTTAEKLLKKTDTWEALQPLITRSEGKPSVAPTSDKRPPLSVGISASDFN